MRSLNYVQRVSLDFTGTLFPHAICLGDADNDSVSTFSFFTFSSLLMNEYRCYMQSAIEVVAPAVLADSLKTDIRVKQLCELNIPKLYVIQDIQAQVSFLLLKVLS